MSQIKIVHLAKTTGYNTKKMKKAMKGYCIAVLWGAFEEDLGMAEQAALAAVCETMNVPEDHAYELMTMAKTCGLLEDK